MWLDDDEEEIYDADDDEDDVYDADDDNILKDFVIGW